MEHRGIWAAVGACLIAGALVAPPGSALSPQRLITDVLQPAAVPTASAAPATPDPEVQVTAPDHPELAPVVPVLVEAAPPPPSVTAPTATADSIRRTRPRASTPPKTSAPKPSAQAPAPQPPKVTPAPSSPPPVNTPKPIKRPDKRGNPVKPGPPVTKGAPKSADKTGTTALARSYAVTVREPTTWYRGDQRPWSARKPHAGQASNTRRAGTPCPETRQWRGHAPRTWAGKNWHGQSRSFRVSW